jgi:hypothetical protein
MIVSKSGQFHLEIDGPQWPEGRAIFPYADCLIFKQNGEEFLRIHTTDFSPKIDETSSLNDNFSIVGDQDLVFVVHYDDCSWLPSGTVTWDLHTYLPDEQIGEPIASGELEVL